MKKADEDEGSSVNVAEAPADEKTISPLSGQPPPTDPASVPSAAASAAAVNGRPRIGPYEVMRPLVDAPGARLVEARDGDGHSVVLQVAHVRAASSESEKNAQLAYVRSIQRESEALSSEPEIGLLAHGEQDEPDGTKTIYWAIRWREGATRLGHAAAHVRSVEHFLKMATQLTERVRDRHAAGRFDPLLSYAMILVQPDAGASFVGMPIHLPPEWLAEDIPGAAFAPEETLRRMPTKGGDLWRLGRSLSTLAKELAAVPAALRSVLDSLADPDPMLRMASASTALVELAKLNATSAEDLDGGPLADRLGFDSVSGREPIALTSPKVSPSGGGEIAEDLTPSKVGRARPASIADAPTLTDLRSAGLRAAAYAEMVTRPSGIESALAPNETLRGLQTTPKDTILDLSAPTREQIDEAIAQARGTPPVGAALIEKPSADAAALAGLPTTLDFGAPSGPGGTVIGVRKMAHAAPQSVPTFAPSIGPGGTVLGVRPKARDVVASLESGLVHAASQSTSPSPLPSRVAPASTAITANTVSLPVERFSGRAQAGDPASEDDSSLGDWTPGRSPAQIAVAGLVAVAVVGGFIALASSVFKESTPGADDSGPRSIGPFSDVLLEVAPPEATVVAELDGRILGKAPMSFLMPEGGGTPVLITADGFEPQRILLPARGRMRVSLIPLESGQACDIDLRIPGGAVVEAVAAKVEIGTRTHVPGAAVLRADGRGAWLVACPSLGGSEVQALPARAPAREIDLAVKGPQGTALYVDGKAAGDAPAQAKVTSGFRTLRLEGKDGLRVERWVPLERDTTVEMPPVKAAVDSPIATGNRR